MIRLGELILWSWIFDHLHLIGAQLVQHIVLTVIAVTVGLAISLPLGILGHRHRWVQVPTTVVADLLYTIPSLALFAFLVPITHLTYLTVEIALVSYTLLILVRNVVAGLAGVPEDAKDAARGMGLELAAAAVGRRAAARDAGDRRGRARCHGQHDRARDDRRMDRQGRAREPDLRRTPRSSFTRR